MKEFLEHPDYPCKLEYKGQEVIRHYPEGATAIGSVEEWLMVKLLIKLDRLIERNPSIDLQHSVVSEGDLERVAEMANDAIDQLLGEEKAANRGRKR